MKMSPEGIRRLKKREGCKLKAYRDQARVWTIGYGFTLGVKEGDTMTQEECEARLLAELVPYEQAVRIATKGQATQSEFNALVSFAWNVGIDGMKTSSVIRAHNRGDKAAAARAMGLWNKITVGGKKVVSDGLVWRRADEGAEYLTDSNVGGMPQAVEPPKSVVTSSTVVASGTAVIAMATQVAEAFGKLRGSVTELGDWLAPVLGLVAVAAVGYVIYERYRNRERGAI